MSRPTKPLTDVAIRNAKPRPKTFKLADGGGLYLEVMPAGGKSWRMKYRHHGVEKRVSFGMWPAVGLQEARKLRDEGKALLAQGIDLAEKRKQDKADTNALAVEAATTLETVAKEWHARQSRRWSEDHAARIMRRMGKHLFPRIGSSPIASLTAPGLMTLLHEIEGRGHYETAHRLRQYLEAIFAYAIASGKGVDNPAASIAKAMTPHRAEHRAALVSVPDASRLFRAVWNCDGRPETVTALKLLSLTACRPGEVQKAAWVEIDLKAPGGPLWTIPASKTKMRRDHCVPLSSKAVDIIEAIRPLTGTSPYLFPHMTDNQRPMSNVVLNNALRRLGFGKDETCAHGFRSTFSTLARETGWAHHVIEAALAHVQGSTVAQAYDRAQYLTERRKLMNWWADYLDALKAGAKVTPLHSGKTGTSE